MLSQDTARCAGDTATDDPNAPLAAQCQTCLRRTAPRIGEWISTMQPFKSARFGCCPMVIAPREVA